jgi:hypothetical protein
MISFNFELQPCNRRIVSFVGLTADDRMLLEYMACPGKCPDDGTEKWIPFRPGNCPQVSMTTTNNPMLIDFPGKFRFVFEGATNPDVVMCASSEYPTNCASVGGFA